MLSSLADSSIKQYDSCLKKWWCFCQHNDVDFYNSDIKQILKFLTEEFNKGASHGSLNSCRSAISLLQGAKIGENPLIRRLFTGITKLRPSKPKYDVVWNPQIVLDHISEWGDNNVLTLEKLTLKLVTLLALITAHRMQTLSLINVQNIEKSTDLIQIKIPDRIKTSKLNKTQPILIIPYFHQDKRICPASALEDYLEKTKELRENETRLFISFKKPYKEVTSQTLSRWIKKTLQDSGVDVNIFDAYSTRHAATSLAKKNGVGIDIIKKCAGWTEKSGTFARFYNCHVVTEKELFAHSILNRIQ